MSRLGQFWILSTQKQILGLTSNNYENLNIVTHSINVKNIYYYEFWLLCVMNGCNCIQLSTHSFLQKALRRFATQILVMSSMWDAEQSVGHYESIISHSFSISYVSQMRIPLIFKTLNILYEKLEISEINPKYLRKKVILIYEYILYISNIDPLPIFQIKAFHDRCIPETTIFLFCFLIIFNISEKPVTSVKP